MSDVPATPPVASLLPPATLDRGVRLLGHAHSLDSLFRRLHAGKAITIGVLGASVATAIHSTSSAAPITALAAHLALGGPSRPPRLMRLIPPPMDRACVVLLFNRISQANKRARKRRAGFYKR